MTVPVGNVVQEFTIGNTRIKICDDAYRDKTKEDVDRILKNLGHMAYEFLNAQENLKARQKNGEEVKTCSG